MVKEVKEEDNNTEQNFSDKLDVMKFVADIKLRLKRDITTDFVLAKLEGKDKEAIIEMTSNAYFAKKLLLLLSRKSRRWIWNEKKGEYEKQEISKEDKKYLEGLSDAVFDSYMTRIYMTVVLNRNVDKNYLINVLSGYKEEVEGQDIDMSAEEASSVLKEVMKNQEKKEK